MAEELTSHAKVGCNHGMSAHGRWGCVDCACKTPGFGLSEVDRDRIYTAGRNVERAELDRQIVDRLVEAYTANYAGIAKVLDKDIDPSGNLLGWLRTAAFRDHHHG